VGWAEAGRRLCDFSAERRTTRWDVAEEGREGCVLDVRCVWKVRWEVVGRTKGNGIAWSSRRCHRLHQKIDHDVESIGTTTDVPASR
jgi:hypothetical protein